jgi:hypothetical protein
MSEYGLPDVRDKDGELRATEHTFEWDGDEITIKLVPPTIPQYDEYVNLGEEAGNEELREVLDEHLVKPDIPADAGLTMRELLCYVNGIVDYCQGDAGIAGKAREELEERQEDMEGN